MAGKKTSQTLSGPDKALQIGMAILGATLLLGSLAVVLRGAVTEQRPALVEVVETGRTRKGDRVIVSFEAFNSGDGAAAQVTVRGVPLGQISGPDASIVFEHLPGRSRRTGALTFQGDVGAAPLSLEATGWVEP